jgi:hypothetical protein
MNEIDQIQKPNPHKPVILLHPATHFGRTAISPSFRHPSPSPPTSSPPHLLAIENPCEHPGRPNNADPGISSTNSSSGISHPKLRASAKPKCTHISCVLSGYKLIRTQQVVLSKLQPLREDTTANHFRPVSTLKDASLSPTRSPKTIRYTHTLDICCHSRRLTRLHAGIVRARLQGPIKIHK